MTAFIRAVAAALLLTLMPGLAAAADKAIIVLDASGSMWGQIDGKPKLEIARETLRTVLQTVPADLELGLMAYGHREKGSCEDIELVVPPASGTGPAISAAADSMKFLGKTPLSAAVRKAAEDLRYTEDKATVILITDGLETCRADPCAVGKELEQSGVDFTAHVVGFGLTAEEGRQVACLAENTGGKYFQASDAPALKDALVAAVTIEAAPEPAPAPAPPPAPEPAKLEFNFTPAVTLAPGLDPLGNEGQAWEIYKARADGTRGDYVTTSYGLYKATFEPGDYVVVARLGKAQAEQKVTLTADAAASPVFVLDAGRVVIRPRPSEGADISKDAAVNIRFSGGESNTYGETKIVLPAGEQALTVSIGRGVYTETFQLAAGEAVEKDIVIGVGVATVNAFYATGGDKVVASGMFVQVLKAAKKIDGSRDEMANGYGADQKFSLPSGDYILRATMDKAVAEQPFNIRAGETKDVTVVLNAGVLAISAPGAYMIKVFEAKKDIQGNRKDFGYAYGEAHQTTLPAGDYAVTRELSGGDGVKEAPATVKAGERTEVTVQ